MSTESDRQDLDDATSAGGIDACRAAQLLIILVATVLHGIFLSQAKPLQSANDRSRWCTVWSLVERGTFQIDEIRQRSGWDTIDLVHVDDHFYSTKPPLLTTLVAGITWCVQRATGWNLFSHLQEETFVVLLIVNLVPFLVSLLVFRAIVNQVSTHAWTQLLTVVVASFGTLLTPFLMTLNNHTVAAAAVTVAFYAILKILREDAERPAIWPYVLCGLAASWSAANELPAASFAAILLALAARQSFRNTLIGFLPAAAVPAIALIATNVIATGSWKPFYADYGTDKYRFVIDGIPSYWMQPKGIDRNLDSPATYFLHCMIGHHGLFSLTPLMLLALAGWVTCFQLRDRALRTLLWLGGITSAIVIAFYLTRTQNYNYGGVSCGLRWALWLTPFWLVAMVPVADWCARSWWSRGPVLLLLIVSMYSAWQPIETPWRQPWLFQWMEARGWIDYSDEPPELPRPLWSWFASLPAENAESPPWIEFTVAEPGLSSRIVRLTRRPTPSGQPEGRAELEFRESSTDETVPVRSRTLLIDVRKFNEGGKPAEFLRWPDAKVTREQQLADLALVRGLPLMVPYKARVMRYLRTTLRPEALHCTQAAAQVAVDKNDTKLVYRCDVWLTEDVPFGVAQLEHHVTQPDTNSVLFHERWVVRDCFPKVPPYKSTSE